MQHLVIDQGNNHLHAALFQDGEMTLTLSSFLPTVWDSIFEKPTRVIYSSVAHTDEHLLSFVKQKAVSLLILSIDTPTPLTIAYSSTLGTDRIAAAVGAWSLAPHQPSLIVDLGTAATFDLIDANGSFLGGSISPGLELRLLSLQEHTARLPLVNCTGPVVWPATETDISIRSGALYGLLAEIHYYAHLADEICRQSEVQVILTGGNAALLQKQNESAIFALPHCIVEPNLTMIGLNHILEYNS